MAFLADLLMLGGVSILILGPLLFLLESVRTGVTETSRLLRVLFIICFGLVTAIVGNVMPAGVDLDAMSSKEMSEKIAISDNGKMAMKVRPALFTKTLFVCDDGAKIFVPRTKESVKIKIMAACELAKKNIEDRVQDEILKN